MTETDQKISYIVIKCNMMQSDEQRSLHYEGSSQSGCSFLFCHTLFCKPLSFSSPWDSNKIFQLVKAQKIYMEEDRFALSVSKDCQRDCKRFADSFAAADRNQPTSFSCVRCRLCYQTLEFYCGKTGQALDFKFGLCVDEHIVCLVKKFDQNL